MRTGDGGLALIKSFEGLRTRAYRDPVGILTIGYGHTSAAGQPFVNDGMVITESEAENILCTDLARFEDAVDGVITRGPNQNQFDAMVSLCMNIGPAAFAKSSVLRLFNEGKDEAAADAFLLWNKAGGKMLAGLTRRRKAERALFLREAPVISARIAQDTLTATDSHEGKTTMLNTNFIHNILNVLIAIAGAVEAFLLASGCTTTVAGQLECSVSWLPQFLTPTILAFILMALGILKTVINLVRDGFSGLFKTQPPVADHTSTIVLASPADATVDVTATGTTKTLKPRRRKDA